MQQMIAGIDGGQTSTTAAVALADGTIVGRGIGPPADLVGEPRGAQTRRQAALGTALAEALAAARMSPETEFAAIVVGLTGHDEGTPDPFPLARVAIQRFVHDTEIAHAGALGIQPGIVVLAGTGSVALGSAEGLDSFVRAGGWGYFFGDEGGALWIARTAIAAAMAEDDRGESSVLARAALSFFNLPDLRAIQHAFAHGELTRPALAAFAAPALALADRGPTREFGPWHLRNIAAGSLLNLVATVDERLPAAVSRRVSYTGGVFASVGLRDTFATMLGTRVPGAVVVSPVGDPVTGAVLLARDLARSHANVFGEAKRP